MAEEEDSYCRLCAEPTAKTQLIAPDEDVGLNSKIATKMMWINIDISTVNNLPNSICFSCFDLLERTWSFLHNVRTAQAKLFEIFLKKDEPENSNVKSDIDVIGKPVNEDWEDFEQLKQDVKPELFNEELQLETVDPKSLLESGVVVKIERDSLEDDFRPDSDGFNSTDSDVPLYQTVKKKAVKKKKKMRYDSGGSEHFEPKNELDGENLTWVDFKCVCADCDTQCDNIMLLRIHAMQIHNRCCVFKCADCGKITSRNRTFINHMRKHKKVLRNCCEYCNKDFANYTYLTSHRRLMHQDVIQMTCRSCGTMFENTDDLKDHIIKYSQSRKYVMKCASKELKCNMCDKEFKTRASLQTHKLLHTERQRNFSCHICGKMFFTKGALSTHLLTHDDAKPFKCEFCPLTFKARGNLSAHITLHSSIKPFVCEQCGKSFRAKRHLKSHSIIHTDLMPYVCNYCKKTFRFKTRLNLHIRQHTGVKPYLCEYCQRVFTNGSNYKKHMKRKHNIDTSKKKYNNIINDNLDMSKNKLLKEDS